MLWARKSLFDALAAGSRANRITLPNIQTPLNSALYSGYEKRKIIRKVLADEIGVTAFDVFEIGKQREISDRVAKAIAEKIGTDHRESFPAYNSAHRNGRP